MSPTDTALPVCCMCHMAAKPGDTHCEACWDAKARGVCHICSKPVDAKSHCGRCGAHRKPPPPSTPIATPDVPEADLVLAALAFERTPIASTPEHDGYSPWTPPDPYPTPSTPASDVMEIARAIVDDHCGEPMGDEDALLIASLKQAFAAALTTERDRADNAETTSRMHEAMRRSSAEAADTAQAELASLREAFETLATDTLERADMQKEAGFLEASYEASVAGDCMHGILAITGDSNAE